MPIRNGPEGSLLVDLPGEPALEAELAEVVRFARQVTACDVVLDFSRVDVLNSSCLAALLRLRNHLQMYGGRLALCNIGRATHGILSVTGLTGVFESSGDMESALAAMRRQE